MLQRVVLHYERGAGQMTITGMAKQLGVSTMTIYRRCKKNGVDIESLRDDVNGELSAAGVAAIASLFDATAPQRAITGDVTQIQPDHNGVAQTMPQGPGAGAAAVLQAKLDGAIALIEQLTGERDALREQVAALQAALAAEQADRQAERRLLTAGVEGEADSHGRRRWWQWLRR